jgi:hypothetical protein
MAEQQGYKCVCCRQVVNDGNWSSDGEFLCVNCCDKVMLEWEIGQDDLRDK